MKAYGLDLINSKKTNLFNKKTSACTPLYLLKMDIFEGGVDFRQIGELWFIPVER